MIINYGISGLNLFEIISILSNRISIINFYYVSAHTFIILKNALKIDKLD